MKPLLCLDFDGVIHSYVSGWKGPRVIPDPPVPGAITFIHDALCQGFRVAIHSSRARYFGGISAMRRYIRTHAGTLWHEAPGFPGIEEIEFFRFKPPALFTIDDRGCQFEGRWPSLELIRQFKPWYKRGAP